MKKPLIFILMIFFLHNSCVNSQDKRFTDATLQNQIKIKPKNLNQKLLVALVTPGEDFINFRTQNNIPAVQVIDEKMSIGEGFNLDYKKFESNINRIFPNADDTGYGFLDYEHPYLDPLVGSTPGKEDFEEAISLYVDAIKFAKKMRPNVKWGHYGLPISRWNDREFLLNNNKYEKIYAAVDIIFPSVYVPYDDQEVAFSENFKYLYDNLEQSLIFGKKYNKPVYAFVMHRFYSDNKRLLFTEMNDDFWKRYLQTVLSVNVNGRYLNGIVWWGADTYFFDRDEGKNVKGDFKGTVKDFMKYNDKSLINKGKIALDLTQNK